MFTLCVIFSLLFQMDFALDSNANSDIHTEATMNIANKCFNFDRMIVNHVMNRAQYRPNGKNDFISQKISRLKNHSLRPNLQYYSRKGVSSHLAIINYLKKVDVEKRYPLGSIHTLKHLMKYHFPNLTTASLVDKNLKIENAAKNINNFNNETTNYNTDNKFGLAGPNFHSKSSPTMRKNKEHGDVNNNQLSLLSEKIKLDKNKTNENCNEIVVIEIPIKSDNMKYKNILLGINELKDMQLQPGVSTEVLKNQDEMSKEIEERIEKKIMRCFQRFKQDIVSCIKNIFEDKTDKNSTIISKMNMIKDPLTDSLNVSSNEEMTTCNQRFSTNTVKARSRKNNIEKPKICCNRASDTSYYATNSQSLDPSQQTSSVESDMVNILKTNQLTSEPKDIIALYDIDLKYPKQIFLVPKDVFANLTHANGNITQIYPTRKPIFSRLHLRMNRNKNLGSEDLLKYIAVKMNIPSHRLKARFYSHHQNLQKMSSQLI